MPTQKLCQEPSSACSFLSVAAGRQEFQPESSSVSAATRSSLSFSFPFGSPLFSGSRRTSIPLVTSFSRSPSNHSLSLGCRNAIFRRCTPPSFRESPPAVFPHPAQLQPVCSHQVQASPHEDLKSVHRPENALALTQRTLCTLAGDAYVDKPAGLGRNGERAAGGDSRNDGGVTTPKDCVSTARLREWLEGSGEAGDKRY